MELLSAQRMAHSSNMELPTLAEFKALLEEEKLFRDYFNAFLNLPVRDSSNPTRKSTMAGYSLSNFQIFAKRLTYNSSTNKFIIEPKVKSRYHVSIILVAMDKPMQGALFNHPPLPGPVWLVWYNLQFITA